MSRTTRGKGEGTNEVDVLVGQRLRELRMLAGLNQTDLAATIDLTFQQLQKYERGVNRISASKLYLLARQLNVPVQALFANLDDVKSSEIMAGSEAGSVAGEPGDAQLHSREALVLMRNYLRIKDVTARLALKAFFEACAGQGIADERMIQKSPDGETSEPVGGGDVSRRPRRPRGVAWHPTDIGRD